MRSYIVLTTLVLSLLAGSCFAQPGSNDRKPPTLDERIKMINEKICQPLKLDKDQTVKVAQAFEEFFVAMDKLIDFKTDPPKFPERSKVDALAKIRDTKVKKIIPENLYRKYEELEMATRPPKGDGPIE